MGVIMVDQSKCNQCGICVVECPVQLLRMDPDSGLPVPDDDFEEVCLRCGHCVVVCPTGAFSLEWLPADDCPVIVSDLKISYEQAEQFLRSRRSIRLFRDKPVERSTLEKLIDIACNAPSAKNARPWNWLVIENAADVRKLDAMIIDWMRTVIKADTDFANTLRLPRTVKLYEQGIYKTLRNAPHLFIVHVDEKWPCAVEDTTLALSYVELFAPVLGLGATWSGFFYNAYNGYPPLAEAVPVPKGQKVVGAMMIGYPKYKYQRLPMRGPARVEWR